MGIIDTATITLTCPECCLSESSRIRDKGSGWGGSHWETPKFEHFHVSISGSPKTDYEVSGKCPKCDVSAEVGHQYNT